MPLTLNQVVARIEKLALSHRQINHFYIGDAAEWMFNGDVKYPACFVDFTSGSISKDDRHTGWDFKILFADLADLATDSRENEMEVFSDLTSIAFDFKSMLGFTGYQNDWDIGESSSLEYLKEKFEDIVYGVMMTQRIDSITPMNRCDVPASDVTFEDNPNSMIVTNYIYNGIGTEGNVLTIGTLKNKTILFLMKGDKTLLPAAVPDENQYLYNSTTGLFTFGTDIEAGQVIQILNR